MRFTPAAILGLLSSGLAKLTTPSHDTAWDFTVTEDATRHSNDQSTPDLSNYKLRGRAVDPGSLNRATIPPTIPSSCGSRAAPAALACPASFFENGPAKITPKLTVVRNPDSWNTKANVLYIDQPVNTGFSYGDAVNTTLTAGKDVYALLSLFFRQFPQYAHLDFHIAGESSVARQQQQRHQAQEHHDWQRLRRPLPPGARVPRHGLRRRRTAEHLQGHDLRQHAGRRAEMPGDDQAVLRPGANVAGLHGGRGRAVRAEPVRHAEAVRGRPDQHVLRGAFDYVTRYLNQPRASCGALGVEVDSWTSCSDAMDKAFRAAGDDIQPRAPARRDDPGQRRAGADLRRRRGLHPQLARPAGLDGCAAVVGPARVSPGADAESDGGNLLGDATEAYGTIKHARRLACARIFKAGHLVTMDQPKGILDLVSRWVDGEFQK
ncbi:hypothetical protein PWT90_05971 [Aphanocladium album]|nr:hypothetical protein PWT90_05971 [Aphanocladium album]